MNVRIILAFFVVGLFLIGCASQQQDSTGYAAYNQPQQQQYVGGGCGVAPSGDYQGTPIKELAQSKNSA